MHLLRWTNGENTFKIDKHAEIDTELTLTDHNGKAARYSLYAVVEHRGPANGGHYVTYVEVSLRLLRPAE